MNRNTHPISLTLLMIFSGLASNWPQAADAQNFSQRGARRGAIAGAVVGGIVGAKNDRPALGVVVGGVGGALIGRAIGQQRDQEVYRQPYGYPNQFGNPNIYGQPGGQPGVYGTPQHYYPPSYPSHPQPGYYQPPIYHSQPQPGFPVIPQGQILPPSPLDLNQLHLHPNQQLYYQPTTPPPHEPLQAWPHLGAPDSGQNQLPRQGESVRNPLQPLQTITKAKQPAKLEPQIQLNSPYHNPIPAENQANSNGSANLGRASQASSVAGKLLSRMGPVGQVLRGETRSGNLLTGSYARNPNSQNADEVILTAPSPQLNQRPANQRPSHQLPTTQLQNSQLQNNQLPQSNLSKPNQPYQHGWPN